MSHLAVRPIMFYPFYFESFYWMSSGENQRLMGCVLGPVSLSWFFYLGLFESKHPKQESMTQTVKKKKKSCSASVADLQCHRKSVTEPIKHWSDSCNHSSSLFHFVCQQASLNKLVYDEKIFNCVRIEDIIIKRGELVYIYISEHRSSGTSKEVRRRDARLPTRKCFLEMC